MKAKEYTKMTFEQIKTSYPDKWVLVLNPELEKITNEIITGFVAYSNKDRQKVSKALQTELKNSEQEIKLYKILYTGEVSLPSNTILCL